jgi:putative sterol carrier protein
VSEFLSPEWIAEASQVLAGLQPVDAVDVTVRYEISSTPHGKVLLQAVVADGRVVSLTSGTTDAAEVTVSCSYDLAVDLVAGRRDAHGEYMTGGLKVEGAHAVWMLSLDPLRRAALPALASLA